jgi:hypothetical protein
MNQYYAAWDKITVQFTFREALALSAAAKETNAKFKVRMGEDAARAIEKIEDTIKVVGHYRNCQASFR